MRLYRIHLANLLAAAGLLLGNVAAVADEQLDAVRDKVAGMFDAIDAEDEFG